MSMIEVAKHKPVLIVGQGNTYKTTIALRLIFNRIENTPKNATGPHSVTFITTERSIPDVRRLLMSVGGFNSGEEVVQYFSEHNFKFFIISILDIEPSNITKCIKEFAGRPGIHHVLIDGVGDIEYRGVHREDLEAAIRDTSSKMEGTIYIVANKILPVVKLPHKYMSDEIRRRDEGYRSISGVIVETMKDTEVPCAFVTDGLTGRAIKTINFS